MRDLVHDKFQQSILFHWSWTAGKVEKIKYSRETGECALGGDLGKDGGARREEQRVDHLLSSTFACALRNVVSEGHLRRENHHQERREGFISRRLLPGKRS